MNERPDPIFKCIGKDVKSVKTIGLLIADQWICGLFVGPLTVFVWWGVWSYLNSYLFPTRMDLSGYVCFAIGNCGLVVLALTQNLWKRYLPVDKTLHWLFGYHIYTCICVFFNVCHWRGLWLILDHFTGVNYLSCWVSYAVGQGFLCIFRSSKNAQAPPMITVYDRDSDHFTYTTRFRVKPQIGERFVLDVLFTVVIIHQLVVFYWRGSWELMDLYIFPDNKTYSALVSFGFAYGLLILLCFVQPLFNFLYRRCAKKQSHKAFWRWLLEVIIYFLSNFVSVGVWRGVWMICDVYVLPDRPDLAHGVILAVGLIVLSIMMCCHSVAIRGCDIDGETIDGEESVCICPNLYIRKFYSIRQSKETSPDVEDQGRGQEIMAAEYSSEKETKSTKLLEHNINGETKSRRVENIEIVANSTC